VAERGREAIKSLCSSCSPIPKRFAYVSSHRITNLPGVSGKVKSFN